MSIQPTSVHSESLARVGAQSESATSRTMMVIAIAWFAVAATMGFAGFFTAYARFLFPFVVTPLMVFVAAFAALPRVRAWAFALDARWFVLFNMIRFAGIAFLILYAHGRLDRNFALTAGWMDFVVAVTAPLVAFYLMPARIGWQRGLLLVWLAFGIADFAISIPFAVMARLADPASVAAVNEFPVVLIPTYFVPLVVVGYFIVLAQLWQQRKSVPLRTDR